MALLAATDSGAAAGLIIRPVMTFHSRQLVVCAWIAGAMAREDEADGRGEDSPQPT